MDVVGSVRLLDDRELKVITGVDDHSRFCTPQGADGLRLEGVRVNSAYPHDLGRTS